MIFHRYKCVFIHIPRTGGTSIEASFEKEDRSGERHIFAHEIPSLPADHFKFSFVRDPWDRMLSYYRWRKSPESVWVQEFERAKIEESFVSWLH